MEGLKIGSNTTNGGRCSQWMWIQSIEQEIPAQPLQANRTMVQASGISQPTTNPNPSGEETGRGSGRFGPVILSAGKGTRDNVHPRALGHPSG
jgi:hypothetical protein